MAMLQELDASRHLELQLACKLPACKECCWHLIHHCRSKLPLQQTAQTVQHRQATVIICAKISGGLGSDQVTHRNVAEHEKSQPNAVINRSRAHMWQL
eukprot:178173-Chlamydomonas_euryale.AAC.5